MIKQNAFLKEQYKYITKFENVNVGEINIEINKKDVFLEKTEDYEKEKEKIISEVKKDPDIIPRRLLKYSESVNKVKDDSLKDRKEKMNVTVSNLKVDQYYYNELLNWRKEVYNVIQRIQRG